LIWDNASWHKSQAVRTWIRQHNQQVNQTGKGVRILPFLLPTQSPWLNPIEPKWVYAKRNVVEHDGLLTARQLLANWRNGSVPTLAVPMNLIFPFPKMLRDYVLGMRCYLACQYDGSLISCKVSTRKYPYSGKGDHPLSIHRGTTSPQGTTG
jgi:hypothetical protein